MMKKIVIVGAGQAAVQAIDTLRRKGYTGELVLIGDEPYPPYQRPPLSKKYLAGALDAERLFLKPTQFYATHSVQTHLGRSVVEIDRTAQRVQLDDGTALSYDGMLIATGSHPRKLTAPGADLGGIYYLRTRTDVENIRSEFAPGKRLVIVGGGYIGLEVAATARELGLEVTVLEMADRVMNRVTCSEVSAFYAAEHQRHGVNIVTRSRMRELAGDPVTGRVRAVLTEEGDEYPADLVVVGVGVLASDQLARAAGIECANGIVVDEHCRTSDPAIYAAGDCTNHPNLHFKRRLRLESVDNAFEQATTAALNMLGTVTVHDKVPWFWSDQYDLKMIIVGLSGDHDQTVVRGDPATRSFSACYLKDGELLAIDTINSAKDQMAARKLIASHARPDLRKLADVTIPLKDCL